MIPRLYLWLRNQGRYTYRKVSRFLTKRDLYVVRIYYTNAAGELLARAGDGTPSFADCALFGGIEDHGLFWLKWQAIAFADWRENDAPYGRGYIYRAEPATDEEIDRYLADINHIRNEGDD